MINDSDYRLSFTETRALLRSRIEERASRIQLLCGPRQVGKTTLLLELADAHRGAIYVAADSPEASLSGFWERLWSTAEAEASKRGRAVVLIDEAQLIHDWASRLKAQWDRLKRLRRPIHIIATGSSALRLATGSRESLAGRFERITLSHWNAASVMREFKLSATEATRLIVERGAYPGAIPMLRDSRRWSAYVRDAIMEPAIGRDVLSLGAIRRPALMRQVFSVCVTSPSQIVSLQKLQGQLQDKGALETIADYLALLQEGFLVASLEKFSPRGNRRRNAPPKLVPLSNAFLAVSDPFGIPESSKDHRYGRWVENACLAYAINAGQTVSYWREEPLEVDAVLEGSWGRWAIEVKTGPISFGDLKGLLEFTTRFPDYRPLLLSDQTESGVSKQAGIASISWRDFLLGKLPA